MNNLLLSLINFRNESKTLIYISTLLSLSFFSIYLFFNFKYYKDGSSLNVFLFFSIFFGFTSIFFKKQKLVYVYKSFFILCLFLFYFILNTMINLPEKIITYTISTDGGVILFYILGVIVSILFQDIKKQILDCGTILNYYNIIFILFSIIVFLFLMDSYIYLIKNLHINLFLLSGAEDGLYQRAGTLISMLFYIYTIMLLIIYIKNIEYQNSKKNRIFRDSLFFIFLVNSAFGIILSQLIGSNNATINLVWLFFVLVVFYIFINFTKSRKIVESTKLSLRELFFGKIATKLTISISLSIIMITIILVCLILILNIDLSKFRIFGFGYENISSISARLELFSNFIIHFNYNPIFGNMAVDKLLTGDGSYVHSFLASILSHLGITGFILFISFLYMAIKEKILIKNNFDNFSVIFELIIFFGIFLISISGVFFIYTPIWFLIGMVFAPIRLEKERNL